MNISRNTWHYRAFDFWFEQKHRLSLEDYEKIHGSIPYFLNLCPYVRVVLIWGPLRFLFSRPRIWYTLSTIATFLLYRLYKYAGISGLERLGILLVCMIIVATAAISAILSWLKFREQLDKHPDNVITSFAGVLSARVRAAHDGICPTIEFVDKHE